MADGIYTALSGALAQQRSLDVVANNVANANTTGYRADRLAFEQSLVEAAGTNEVAPDDTRYVQIAEAATYNASGSLQQTNNPLDLAIQGDGYFEIRTPAGIRYTRAGSFVTDADGTLRTHGGHEVQGGAAAPNGSPIVIPSEAADIQIGSDGTVRADGEEIGRIRLVRFRDPSTVQKEGLTLFTATAPPVDAEDSQVVQGHLEQANVNAVAAMNELITASRSFDAFQKVIQGFRTIDERAARDLGRGR